MRLRPALSLAACLFGVASSAEQASPAGEELLGEVVATYRGGDLKGAWNAFASFLEHPSRNELDIVAFANCFNKRRCPQVGTLGRILGVPRAELAKRIEGFCPRLRSPDVEAALVESGVSESDLAEYRKTYPRIVRNGLYGTCTSWREEQLELMFHAPQPADVRPVALPLAWYEHQDSGFGMAIETLVGSEPLRLGIDTGASLGSLYRRSTRFPDLDVETSGRQTVSKGIFEYLTSEPASVTSLRVGRTLHRPFGLQVSDDDLAYDRHPIPKNGLLGMAFLLGYPAVCFAWDEQRLYLGMLGPCADGAEPYDAHLRGSLLIGFAAEAHDGTRFTARVDTGAWYTNCSAAFSKANAGQTSFSFGDHPALGAECLFDEAVLFKSAEFGFSQVNIRMNDLLRFSAFGWQLNPLRVYFVPRAEADALSEQPAR